MPYNAPYEINLPALGMVGTGTNFEMLSTNVRKYRLANGIPTGLGFEEELENEICKLWPNECEITDTILPLRRRLTLDDVVAGTKVLAAFKLAGSPLVPKEEAERRAAICSNCKLCVPFPRLCSGMCGSLKEVVDQVVGGYHINFDDDHRACSVCHCFAASHVRLPYSILEKGLNDEQKAQFLEAKRLFGCWKTGAM